MLFIFFTLLLPAAQACTCGRYTYRDIICSASAPILQVKVVNQVIHKRPPVPVKEYNQPKEYLSSTPTSAPITTYPDPWRYFDEYIIEVEKVFRGSEVKVGKTLSISIPKTDGMCRVFHRVTTGRIFIMAWFGHGSRVHMCQMFHPPNYSSRRTNGEPLLGYVERLLDGGCEKEQILHSQSPPWPPYTIGYGI
eukprot:sb/3471045/